MPEIRGLGRTLKQWRTPILAWHITGASNGPTEGLNSIIKKIKRVAAGFTEFAHYRTRILLAIGGCDWTLIASHPAKLRRVGKPRKHFLECFRILCCQLRNCHTLNVTMDT